MTIDQHGAAALATSGPRILHTSDWHLGRMLLGRPRYAEFEAFLNWLVEVIVVRRVEVLLVCGDVFDTATPSNRAQEFYYRFLCRVAASPCRHVVLIAGNHDSPSFLNAPRELLRALDVHVIATLPENPRDEVLLLGDQAGAVELIVCAVPYLRDREIRVVEPGESMDDKERKLLAGIREHYAQVLAEAREGARGLPRLVPVVVMGHLFTTGGRVVEGDGVRELYVGSLAQVGAELFPDWIDYLALGHLHVPQRVAGSETRRYSGSPLAMGFGEHLPKSVALVDWGAAGAQVETLPVPVFQPLARLSGDWDAIRAGLAKLAENGTAAWLEIVYQGEAIVGDLRRRVEEAVDASDLQVLRIRDRRAVEGTMGLIEAQDSLEALGPDGVFARCLEEREVPPEQRPALLAAFAEVLAALRDEDPGAA